MKKPPTTKFCCGVPYPQEQCEDCPMRAWDRKDAVSYAQNLVETGRNVSETPSTPTKRLLNLALAFLGKRAR